VVHIGTVFSTGIRPTSITIPASVTSIAASAFYNCNGLTNVTFLGNAPSAGTLFNSSSVSTIIYYYSGTSGWGQTFSGKPTYELGTGYNYIVSGSAVAITGYTGSSNAIVIPASINGYPVTSIATNAFQDASVTSVVIPGSVSSIRNNAFLNCTGLTNITFLGNLPGLGNNVFGGDAADAIVNYYYPAAYVGQTFGGLPAIELGIPFICTTNNNAITITGYVGSGGTVTIPADISGYPVVAIGANAFQNATNITSIIIGNSVTNIGDSAFAGCSNLTNVLLPANLTSISPGTFAGTASLTNITLPNSLTAIGAAAFSGSGLQSLVIPEGITNIGDMAFQNCGNLTNITFLGNAPALGGPNVFLNVPANAVVYYYKGASNWSTTYGNVPTTALTWAPLVGNVSAQSGSFSFSFVNANGLPVVIEASADLVNWQPVWTNNTPDGFFNATNFTDLQWTNYPNRYYRAQ
jgi:hypothetical protein